MTKQLKPYMIIIPKIHKCHFSLINEVPTKWHVSMESMVSSHIASLTSSQTHLDRLFIFCTWAGYRSASGAIDCDWIEMTTVVN